MSTLKIKVDPRLLELFEFRARKGDLKKIEIIQAAIEVLSTQGLENTTYESIALKINSRRAHVAYHFKDKKMIFLAAVKYILGTFEQTVIDTLEVSYQREASPIQKLHSYIDGVFHWAQNNPNHVSVMLLLYYQCTLDPEYVEVHEQVRAAGAKRLGLLMREVPRIQNPERKAKWLQNQISGAIMDAKTTTATDLQAAKESTHNFLDLLII